MARYMRLVMVCLALGAVAPAPARAAYAEIARAPVAAAVRAVAVAPASRRTIDRTHEPRAIDRHEFVVVTRVFHGARRYLVKQSLLL